MMVDNALAKSSIFSKMLDGGDTGRRRVEHRNFLQLWFTHQNVRFRLSRELVTIRPLKVRKLCRILFWRFWAIKCDYELDFLCFGNYLESISCNTNLRILYILNVPGFFWHLYCDNLPCY